MKFIYIFILARISRTIRLYERDRECVSVCVVVKYFDCCSVLCALRIRCMLYVVLFFFFNWNYSRARLDVFVARRNNRIKSMCTCMRKNVLNLKSSPVYSWSHGGRRTQTHAHAYIMWKAVVVYVSNGILIFFLYWENKTRIHVCCCWCFTRFIDCMHEMKIFSVKNSMFPLSFWRNCTIPKKRWLQTNGKCIFFIVQFSLACQTKPNTKCMYGENIQIDELMLIYGLVRCTDEMIGPMNKTSYLNPVGHLTPIKKYCLWPFISSREEEKNEFNI